MKKFLIAVVLIALAAAGGYAYFRWYTNAGGSASTGRKALYWVDPMHPWYKSDRPGIAPDCNMKLVPVYAGDEKKYERRNEAPGTVHLAEDKQRLMGVGLAMAEYQTVAETIRAAARVTMDETRIAKVNARLEGWIDQVFVDFTGKYVKKGDPLLTLYSPEALATQQEYLLAMKAVNLMHDSPVHEMMASNENLVAAARKRLLLWDITERQIDEIGRTGRTIQNLTLDSPISGYVTERNAFPKQRVTPETALYTIADLSTVWVVADVFEYEAANVRIGMAATMTLGYLPGRAFRGRVSYILPQVDPNTRTLKVRIQFDNPGTVLKPDMYGDVELRAGGVRRLVVPRSAVLDSGDKQVVFLDAGDGKFEPRDVKTGAEAGGKVEILSGLKGGERIVSAGNFLIDSESRMK
jgi:membrane fusion protein, copper/silver efflux system